MLHLEAPLYLKYFQHEKSLPEFEPKENKRFSEASKKDNIWFGKENEKPNCQGRQTFLIFQTNFPSSLFLSLPYETRLVF
jgi:hypothetical protein